MPFEKGQSGNPGGRPKVELKMRELAQSKGPDAIDKLIEHMEGDDARLAQTAAIALLDRGFGKPAQSVDVTADVSVTEYIREVALVKPGTKK